MHRRGGSLSQASRSINPFDELFEQSGRNAQAGYIAIGELPNGVKVSGRYRVRVTASSNNQRHPWGEIIKTDQDQPLTLGVVIYDAAKGDAHRYHSSEQSLMEYAMPESGEKRTVELEMWLQQGWAPRFTWANAPFRAYRNGERLLQRYHPKLYQRRPPIETRVDGRRSNMFKRWPATSSQTTRGLRFEFIIWRSRDHCSISGRPKAIG